MGRELLRSEPRIPFPRAEIPGGLSIQNWPQFLGSVAGVVVVGACLLESDVSLSLMGSEGRNSLSYTQLSSPTGRAEGPAEPTVQAVFSSPALARAKVWFYSH